MKLLASNLEKEKKKLGTLRAITSCPKDHFNWTLMAVFAEPMKIFLTFKLIFCVKENPPNKTGYGKKYIQLS